MSEPDYEDDIVFKPEMSWEEFKEWAKEKSDSCEEIKPYSIKVCSLFFSKSGAIYSDITIISENRTPAQMKAILENLL